MLIKIDKRDVDYKKLYRCYVAFILQFAYRFQQQKYNCLSYLVSLLSSDVYRAYKMMPLMQILRTILVTIKESI